MQDDYNLVIFVEFEAFEQLAIYPTFHKLQIFVYNNVEINILSSFLYLKNDAFFPWNEKMNELTSIMQ